jgi:hypothetical protein
MSTCLPGLHLIDCELVHCLQIGVEKTENRAPAPFLSLPSPLRASDPPSCTSSNITTMELVNASANSVNDAPAKGANDGTGEHSQTPCMPID